MSDVTRYDMDERGFVLIDPTGDYVTYDDYAALRARLEAVEAENAELQATFDATWEANMRGAKIWREITGRENTLPDQADMVVTILTCLATETSRAERAEAALEAVEMERDNWQRKHESQLKVDFGLVDKYRRPKSGNFHFPEDVAHIIRKLDAAEAALARLEPRDGDRWVTPDMIQYQYEWMEWLAGDQPLVPMDDLRAVQAELATARRDALEDARRQAIKLAYDGDHTIANAIRALANEDVQ
jgi:hypothetical protein